MFSQTESLSCWKRVARCRSPVTCRCGSSGWLLAGLDCMLVRLLTSGQTGLIGIGCYSASRNTNPASVATVVAKHHKRQFTIRNSLKKKRRKRAGIRRRLPLLGRFPLICRSDWSCVWSGSPTSTRSFSGHEYSQQMSVSRCRGRGH
jgi:hypothetical protein